VDTTLQVPLQQSQGNAQLNARHALILDETFHETGPRPLLSEGLTSSPFNSSFVDVHFRWLYALNLTTDADFRLKNKARGIKNDPPLGDGWGHWVPEEPYQAYIKEYGYQIEV
jgi:hypothetical protein